MSATPRVIRVRDGEYLIDVDGRMQVVHVGGERGNRWLHWNGQVFHRPFEMARTTRATRADADARQSFTAPMPATVLKISVEVGTSVRRGDTLLVLEAMKMELPLRAEADAVVSAVRCEVGQLVQAGAVLVELE